MISTLPINITPDPSAPPLGTAMLILILVIKELSGSTGDKKWMKLAKNSDIACIPLIFMFVIVVCCKIMDVA